ncbi:MAG: hypothetical protein QW057_03310 [Candidatus Bathyarchaeia archaeon]
MYDQLLQALKNETEKEELQKLPRDFYEEVRNAARELIRRTRAGAEGKVAEKLLILELEKITDVLARLVEKRLSKMLRNSLRGLELPDELIVEDERRLLGAVMDVTKARDDLLASLTATAQLTPSGEPSSEVGKPMLLLRFLREVPSIVGVDMRTYGPFKPEDVALLPAENAEALMRQGAALRVQAA